MKKEEKISIIAKEFGTYLFPQYMLVDGMNFGMKKYLKKTIPSFSILQEKGELTYLGKKSEWDICHKILIKELESNIRKMYEYNKKSQNQTNKLNDFSKRVFKANIGKYSNSELSKFLNKFYKLNLETYSIGLLLPVLEFWEFTYLTNRITDILKKKKGEKYISLLTTPNKETFAFREGISLLKLTGEISKKRKLKNFIKNNSTEKGLNFLEENYPDIFKKLKNHTQKYLFIFFNLNGPALQPIDFLSRIKDNLSQKKDPLKKIEELKNSAKNVKQDQKEIASRLKLTKEEKDLINFAKEVAFDKLRRKESQFLAYYHVDSLFREIAKRLFVTPVQAKLMTHKEIEKALKDKKADITLLNRRFTLLVYNNEKTLSGDKAKKFLKEKVYFPKRKTNVKKLQGQCACPGKTKGIVKIVNTVEDIEKMNQGNILVSYATNPTIVPAMKKASAILTEEGGLTCHAAIVSRELKIPCVVGISELLSSLKDEMKLEVDATRGKIKVKK